MKMQSFTILLLGVGLTIFVNQSSAWKQGESRGQEETSKKWIGDWQPSNKRTKVYVDGQHRATIRSGGTSDTETIYIRSDDGDTWKRLRYEYDTGEDE